MPSKLFECGITGLQLPTNPTDAVNKAYVDLVVGNSVNSDLPFFLASGVQQCIPTTSNTLPFFLSNGIQSDINLGC